MDVTTYEQLRNEREEFIREVVSAVSLQLLPKIKEEVGNGYVEEIKQIVNHRFDELDTASEARHRQLVEQTEARFALTATKEELTGVQKSGAENTERIGRLEATVDAKFAEHDKRLAKVEDIQRKQSENIEAMTGNVATVTQNTERIRQSVQLMQNTVQEEIERDKRRQEEVDRRLEEARTRDEEQNHRIASIIETQDEDRKLIRNAQSEIVNVWGDMADQRNRIVEALAPLQLVVIGDKAKGVRGVNDRVAFMEDRLSLGMFLIGTPIGRAMLVVLLLLIIQRPDIIGALLPALNQN